MGTTHADPTTGIEPAAGEAGGTVDAAVANAGGTGTGKIVCNACPVLCNISEGRSGACDRYANVEGVLTRLDPLVLVQRMQAGEQVLVRPGRPVGVVRKGAADTALPRPPTWVRLQDPADPG